MFERVDAHKRPVYTAFFVFPLGLCLSYQMQVAIRLNVVFTLTCVQTKLSQARWMYAYVGVCCRWTAFNKSNVYLESASVFEYNVLGQTVIEETF